MEIQTHFAAQYLATASKSFLPAKSDDSHTNLGFDVDMLSLTTHPLSENGSFLAFNYKNFCLEWSTAKGKTVLPLDQMRHNDVLQWLEEQAKKDLGKAYIYDLHYELPYTIDDNYKFKLKDPKDLERLSDLRVLAQLGLEAVAEEYQLGTDIRIWPHHFDTGGFAALPDTNLSLGFGLAIPDSLCNSHYFYLSAYHNNTMVSTAGFSSLQHGAWLNTGFKGAILASDGMSEKSVFSFFKEAIKQYLRT